MTNLLILAAEEEPSGLDLILPAVDELVWGLVAFAVVAYFMMRKALPKIREGIEAREKAIQDEKEGAESARAEANRLADEYKQKLAEAKTEANRILEEARRSAEEVRKDLIAKAEKDAQAVVGRAQEQIAAEKSRTLQELRSQVAELSIDLAEKVVGRSLDRPAQTKLIDDYITEVGSMNGGSQN
ncbi:MAG: F0F1 ATP synthase subunit B [Actinomycetota bacterium]